MVDAATHSNGGMIALLPADPDPLVGTYTPTVPPEEHHVTLAYLGGDVTGWNEGQRAHAVAAARAAAAPLSGPIAARVMGHATFNPDGGPDGDRDPCAVHLVGDSTDLAPLRARLTDELRARLADVVAAAHEPTIWHATAGYGLTAADLSYTGPVTFDRVLVRLAGDDTVIDLDAAPASPTERAGALALTREALRPVPGAGKTPEDRSEALARITAYRRRVHRRIRSQLAPVIAAYTATAPAALIRAAIPPDAPRGARKAAAGLALSQTLYASGHVEAWLAANAAAQSYAFAAGNAAAAHDLSGGAVDLAPAPEPDTGTGTPSTGIPGSISAAATPTAALDLQLDGLAGDLADLYRAPTEGYALDLDAIERGRRPSGRDRMARRREKPALPEIPGITTTVSDEMVADSLDEALGAWVFTDFSAAGWFLDGALSLYSASGVSTVNWTCCPPECQTCRDLESEGPYLVGFAPGPPHPGCMCWTTPN